MVTEISQIKKFSHFKPLTFTVGMGRKYWCHSQCCRKNLQFQLKWGFHDTKRTTKVITSYLKQKTMTATILMHLHNWCLTNWMLPLKSNFLGIPGIRTEGWGPAQVLRYLPRSWVLPGVSYQDLAERDVCHGPWERRRGVGRGARGLGRRMGSWY